MLPPSDELLSCMSSFALVSSSVESDKYYRLSVQIFNSGQVKIVMHSQCEVNLFQPRVQFVTELMRWNICPILWPPVVIVD